MPVSMARLNPCYGVLLFTAFYGIIFDNYEFQHLSKLTKTIKHNMIVNNIHVDHGLPTLSSSSCSQTPFGKQQCMLAEIPLKLSNFYSSQVNVQCSGFDLFVARRYV